MSLWLLAFEFTFTFGLLLGLGMALLVVGGIAVGIYIGKRRAPSEQQLKSLLTEWTNGVSGEVLGYQDEVNQLVQQYRSSDEAESGDDQETRQLLNRICEANDGLQQRLLEAEKTLKDQAQAISGYASEARTDSLTKLPNRRCFDDEMNRRVAEWNRHGTPLSLILLDIDHFKQINDVHGHLAGDQILQVVAEELRGTARKSDLVSRYGGEEFAVVLPNCRELAAVQVAERIRRTIECASFSHDGRTIAVTISCGVAQIQRGENSSALTKRADEALYSAKESGRNRVACSTEQGIVASEQLISGLKTNNGLESEPFRSGDSFDDVCDDLRKRLDSLTNH